MNSSVSGGAPDWWLKDLDDGYCYMDLSNIPVMVPYLVKRNGKMEFSRKVEKLITHESGLVHLISSVEPEPIVVIGKAYQSQGGWFIPVMCCRRKLMTELKVRVGIEYELMFKEYEFDATE